MVGNIYAGIFVERVRRGTGDMTDDEQGGFRVGSSCVDQIFKLKQIGEKTQEKKRSVYVSFIDLEKPYDRIHRESMW